MFFTIFIMLWCSCCYIAIYMETHSTHTKLFCRGFCHYVSHGCPQLTSIESSPPPPHNSSVPGWPIHRVPFSWLGFQILFSLSNDTIHKSLFFSLNWKRYMGGIESKKEPKVQTDTKVAVQMCVLVQTRWQATEGGLYNRAPAYTQIYSHLICIVSPFVTICITTEHASLSQTGQKHFFPKALLLPHVNYVQRKKR